MNSDDPRGTGRLTGALRVLAPALPVWLLGLLLVSRTTGGSADPWDAPMGYGHAMWFGAHALLRFAETYESLDPVSGTVFPLSGVGAALGTLMGLGSWFAWQILLIGVNAAALTWLVRRLAGILAPERRADGWVVCLVGLAAVAVLAPVRAALEQGSLDLLGLALAVSALPGNGPWRRRPRAWAGMRLGAAAAVWLWPLALLVPLACARIARRAARRDGQRAPEPAEHLGAVALACFVLLTVCGFLVLPWDSTDFWAMVARGRINDALLDPSLGRWLGTAGWVAGVLVAAAACALAAGRVRRRDRAMALAWMLVGLTVALPGHWAGQGSAALVAAACAIAALRARSPVGAPVLASVLCWAGWTLLWPADLLAGTGFVGPVLGLTAVVAGTVGALRGSRSTPQRPLCGRRMSAGGRAVQ